MSESQVAPWRPQEWIEEVDHICATVDADILAPALQRAGIGHLGLWEGAVRALDEDAAAKLRKDLRTRVVAANFAREVVRPVSLTNG